MVFDKSVSDPANITISEDSDFLNRLITSGFYRVLCKSAMGGGEVFVCRLKKDNSNLYLDGSQANLTGPEGDVMVVFLEFWYKWYKVDDNRFLYHFADHDIDGTYIHVPESLVGAYKGYVSLNRLYSRSDVTPTTNVSLSDFRSYAKTRGIREFVEGVEINNRVWKITDPDGSTRNVNAGTVSGWIKNTAAENGPFF